MRSTAMSVAWSALHGAVLVSHIAAQSATDDVCQTCCFSDGVKPALRKNLSSAASYPVGLWMNGAKDAGGATTAAARILIEEMLGFHTVTGAGQSAGAMAAYRAVAGCPSPEDETSCSMNQTGTRTLWHISLDVRQAFQATELVPSLSYTEAGRMTYVGRKGHFVKEDAAWSATALRSYKDLQGNLSVYAFDNVNSLDRTDLVQCSSTPLANTSMIRDYLDLTADNSGVNLGNGGFVAFCPADGYFWLAPSCRSDSSKCIPYLMTMFDSPRDVLEVMQKAAQWNIPWAIAMAASRVTLNKLLLESRSMYFRYIPDTHPPLSSREVIFPSHDSFGWDNGNLSTAAKEIPIRKIVSSDLIQLAPSVHALIASFDLNLTLLNELLQEADGADLRPAACYWLKKHPAVWQEWLEQATTTTTTTTTTSTTTTSTNRNTTNTTKATGETSSPAFETVISNLTTLSVSQVIGDMAVDPAAIVGVQSTHLDAYNMESWIIGLPTLRDSSSGITIPISIATLVLPEELRLPSTPGLLLTKASSASDLTMLPEEVRPGMTVTVSGQQYQVADLLLDVTLLNLATAVPLAVQGLQEPILIRISSDSSISADSPCAFLNASNLWSQDGVYRPTVTEIEELAGPTVDTTGVWCATRHLSLFTILKVQETATECTFAESLWAGDESCFSPMNVFFLFGIPILVCGCVGLVCCYFKCRRPTKGKLKLEDQRGGAHEFEFKVEKAVIQGGPSEDTAGKSKIYVKWDVDLEQAKQTDYDFIKSGSGVNVTGTGLLFTADHHHDVKSEKSNSPRSVRSRKLTEAEEEATHAFYEATFDAVHHEDFHVEIGDDPELDLPKRSISGLGYEAYGNRDHVEYFSLTHKKWLQGCIIGTGKLVEEGEKTSSLIPVYSIVLVGGAVHQQRDMVDTAFLRTPLRQHDPVSIQVGQTSEDWVPGIVKSRQSRPLGYRVEFLEAHPTLGSEIKVPAERVRARFPDAVEVEVYRGVKLGWFPGVVRAPGNGENMEAWPEVVVEMAPHWESDSKENVTCLTCHVRVIPQKPPPEPSGVKQL